VNDLIWRLLVTFSAIAAGQTVLLFTLRFHAGWSDRRRRHSDQRHRVLVITALMGDSDEAVEALEVLRSIPHRRWKPVETQIFGLVPKVAGEAHDAIVALLLERGALARADRLSRSRSVSRRCLGAHHIGLLGASAGMRTLGRLISDPDPLVRRVALRALGSVATPAATEFIIDSSVANPDLSRVGLSAAVRLGLGAEDALVAAFDRGISSGDTARAVFAAQALGVIGSIVAVRPLSDALETAADPGVLEACVDALGRIGAPSAVDAIEAALRSDDEAVALAAARALGMIGMPSSVAALAASLAQESPVAREAAVALSRMGELGTAALQAAVNPHAHEVLAAKNEGHLR
jgi:HEAT repeat protein